MWGYRYFGCVARVYFIFMCWLYFIFVLDIEQEYQDVFCVGIFGCDVGNGAVSSWEASGCIILCLEGDCRGEKEKPSELLQGLCATYCGLKLSD